MSEWRRIGDLPDIRRGASPRPIGDPKYFGGAVGWVRIADVTRASRFLRETEQYVSSLGESLSVRVNPGDLVMSICGTLGRPIIIDMPACIHDGFVQFSNLRNTYSSYLFYALQYSEPAFNGMGQPGTQTNLNTALVGRHKVFAPRQGEQRRIAEILSTVDEAIEQTEALIAKYQQIKAGLMHDLFTRGLTADGRLRTTHDSNRTRFGWMPKDWRIGSLLDVTDLNRQPILTGPFGADLGNEDFVPEGVPVLRIGNVQLGRLDLSDLLYVTETKARELERYKIKEGDLLFARQGATTGRNALASRDVEGYLINYHIIRVALDHSRCAPIFIEAAFSGEIVRRQIEREKGRGTREGINTAQLEALELPLAPVAEQRAIAAILLSQSAILANTQSHVENLRRLKHGLMHDLLSGKVRVDG